MTLTKKNQGFTIVELLIVIVVIGILAAIVLNTFSGVQRRARNTNRETDITAIHSQLEVFFADNGQYPLLANINDATWRGSPGDNMPGLDAEALNDPGNDPTPGALVATPAALDYAYQPYNDANGVGGAACDNAATICDAYILTATYEGTGTFVKNDLN